MSFSTRKVNVDITTADGKTIFEKKNVIIPKEWSDKAAGIAASRYFNHDEGSVLELYGRIARQIKLWGDEQGYFDDEEDALDFMAKLEDILLDQRACFNSPVLFNIGVEENSNQVAACFIYTVEDNMEDILAHGIREGMTFRSGSGAGVNVSKLRAKGELLSNRGIASGPISFMRIYDQIASSIKSGGKTRRSAKMVTMEVDHPDIEEFIYCKLNEEKKAKMLVAAGVPTEEAYQTVAFQNANHSIMVSDEFMTAVQHDLPWGLRNRGDGEVWKVVQAKELFKQIAQVAWEVGDPGIQFYDRINQDNPVPSLGNIEGSNPCGEHLAINNSACNLASLNLVKYQTEEGFDKLKFEEDIEIMVTAQDIMIDRADYPTEEAKKVAIETRPIGLGFTNLGAWLIMQGIPYDSDEGRELAADITKEMSTMAYRQSAVLAGLLEPFKAYKKNEKRCKELAFRLTDENPAIKAIINDIGLRNSQLTLLAPTGTISFLMDCDTTGIEPLFALKATKQLAGGGTLEMVPKCVEAAANQITEGSARIWDGETAVDLVVPSLEPEKRAIFKTANEITPHNHLSMMAACQPYLNGAISKTINMSNLATVEDIEEIYLTAWKQGLKSVTIYRDGSKELQPLVADKDDSEEEDDIKEEIKEEIGWTAYRRELDETRESLTHKFDVAGFKGYLTVGLYDDGNPGEIFIMTQKQGSTMQGIFDSFATAVSLALQYGVPLETLIDKFTGNKFDPAGWTRNEDIKFALSVTDYIFRWMQLTFIDEEEDDEEIPAPSTPSVVPRPVSYDGPPCPKCASVTGRSGSCYLCPQCGETTGCS